MKIQILGTRGVPARHGGFETFAEGLSLYLVSRGHEVTVYCQAEPGEGDASRKWRGVEREVIFEGASAFGTMLFDLKATLRSLRNPGLPLVLGYNTAIFSCFYRLAGRPSVMNMDGIEWKREKWSKPLQKWLRLNEWLGAKLSTHLIADHPVIASHLEQYVHPEKITIIPYGANPVTEMPSDKIDPMRLSSRQYALMIARPEPENSVLEIVRAFSRKARGYQLVVLGRFEPETNAYHKAVMESGSDEVMFAGAIYEADVVRALRAHAIWYVHGHRVGGTNPSLVEALAAANAVIAHDNDFNRWVAGPGARYFGTEDELDVLIHSLSDEELETMRASARARHEQEFNLDVMNRAYEEVLLRYAEPSRRAGKSGVL